MARDAGEMPAKCEATFATMVRYLPALPRYLPPRVAGHLGGDGALHLINEDIGDLARVVEAVLVRVRVRVRIRVRVRGS